jgi:hypothetical protein
MRTMATIARTAVAATLMAAAFTLGISGAAHADRSHCEGGANGFVDISENQSGATQRSVELRPGAAGNRGWINLAVANIQGQQRGFVAIVGHETGDEFWMDWTQDGGNNWIQCGPFVAWDTNQHTTAAKSTSSSASWLFRACGSRHDSDAVVCTSWW